MQYLVPILVAAGERGKRDDGWNWCEPNEPVWVHWKKCDKSFSCGCGISFTGVLSGAATTHAKIHILEADKFQSLLEKIERRWETEWGRDSAERWSRFIQTSPKYLRAIRPSSLVCVEKLNAAGEFQLIPQCGKS